MSCDKRPVNLPYFTFIIAHHNLIRINHFTFFRISLLIKSLFDNFSSSSFFRFFFLFLVFLFFRFLSRYSLIRRPQVETPTRRWELINQPIKLHQFTGHDILEKTHLQKIVDDSHSKRKSFCNILNKSSVSHKGVTVICHNNGSSKSICRLV